MTSSREPRLKENAKAAAITLTAAEVQELDDALDGVNMSEAFGGSRIASK